MLEIASPQRKEICKSHNEIEDLNNEIEKEQKLKEKEDQKLKEKPFKDSFSIESLEKLEILKNFVEQTIGITELWEWKVLYRATRDGFGAQDFHSHCDTANRTLVIIKSTNGSIFG